MCFIYEEENNKDKCWFKSHCKKKLENKCIESDMCILHHKMDFLCSKALLSSTDKYPVPLVPDADGVDKDKFIQLKEIKHNIKSFVTSGQNLFIYSKITGNGKSAWAKKLLLSWFASIIFESDYTCRGLFINVPRFFNELKRNINNPSEYINYVLEEIPNVDLVVWDEIGVKDIGTWEHDILLDCINQRVEKGKSNIYTSNMIPSEIKQKLGDRLHSRIIQTSTQIQFNGKDKRALMKGGIDGRVDWSTMH